MAKALIMPHPDARYNEGPLASTRVQVRCEHCTRNESRATASL